MHLVNKRKISIFDIVNAIFLVGLASICFMPFLHVAAVSFSSKVALAMNEVVFLPKGFNLLPYDYVLKRPQFWSAFSISIQRCLLGGAINVLMTIVVAYPLSKEKKQFGGRTVYAWFFFFTMLFGGGLIPTYVLINDLGLMDSIWALVLPGVPVYNVLLMLNFYRNVPKEMEEAAYIDGANHWQILWLIYVPVSLAAIATMTLFSLVGHWNAWFDGLIYMNHTSRYPLQTYLRSVIITMTNIESMDWRMLTLLDQENLRASQIIVATIPILAVYPFLQRYFVTGIVMGSVKG